MVQRQGLEKAAQVALTVLLLVGPAWADTPALERDVAWGEFSTVVAQRDTATAAWAVALRDAEYWRSKALFQADMDSIHQAQAVATLKWSLDNQMKIVKAAALSSLATAVIAVAIFYAVR